MAISKGEAILLIRRGAATYLDHGAFGVAPDEVLRVAAQMRQRVEAAPRPFFRS